jgi:hypothetical protein
MPLASLLTPQQYLLNGLLLPNGDALDLSKVRVSEPFLNSTENYSETHRVTMTALSPGEFYGIKHVFYNKFDWSDLLDVFLPSESFNLISTTDDLMDFLSGYLGVGVTQDDIVYQAVTQEMKDSGNFDIQAAEDSFLWTGLLNIKNQQAAVPQKITENFNGAAGFALLLPESPTTGWYIETLERVAGCGLDGAGKFFVPYDSSIYLTSGVHIATANEQDPVVGLKEFDFRFTSGPVLQPINDGNLTAIISLGYLYTAEQTIFLIREATTGESQIWFIEYGSLDTDIRVPVPSILANTDYWIRVEITENETFILLNGVNVLTASTSRANDPLYKVELSVQSGTLDSINSSFVLTPFVEILPDPPPTGNWVQALGPSHWNADDFTWTGSAYTRSNPLMLTAQIVARESALLVAATRIRLTYSCDGTSYPNLKIEQYWNCVFASREAGAWSDETDVVGSVGITPESTLTLLTQNSQMTTASITNIEVFVP